MLQILHGIVKPYLLINSAGLLNRVVLALDKHLNQVFLFIARLKPALLASVPPFNANDHIPVIGCDFRLYC